MTGLSSVWWRDDHYAHHLECNSLQADPNIQHLPLLAVSEAFLGQSPLFSEYHKRHMIAGPFARAVVARQHLLFYPFMAAACCQKMAVVSAPDTHCPRSVRPTAAAKSAASARQSPA